MDAVIMAAGLGTRLRPHTLHTPKPLLPVQGRPILDWLFGALPPQVDRVLVVTHYLADQVDRYVSEQKHVREARTVFQDQPQGTGDALLRCRSHIHSEHFLALNGDDLFGAADLARLASFPAGVLAHTVDEPRKFGIIFRKPDGSLDKLVEKPPLDGRQLANTGAYAFPRAVFDIELKLSPRGEYEITDYVTSLVSRHPVQVVEAEFWMPIGTEEAWRKADAENLQKLLK
jgi:NDP-sugar pyrophosphorylase family protein